MTGTLLLTAGLMGLAGAAHCAGMCAAGCGVLSRRCVPSVPVRGTAALLAGRLVAYALTGAGVGMAAQSLHWLVETTAWLKPIWTMVQVMLVGLGLWLLFSGDLPPSVLQWSQRLGRPRSADAAQVHKLHLPGELKAAGAGLLWPLLPCGLLHAALALAALASSPLEAAQVMALFALSSSVGLVGGGWLWRLLPGQARRGADARVAVRLAGAGIAVLALWPLAQHVWAPLQAAWCA